ncbi:MAG: hypothetical protein SGBAC_007454 [Bacillariaceae sp.]
MEEDPNEGKKDAAAATATATATRQNEVSIFTNPAVWSEQAEELYMRGEAAQEPETALGDTTANGHGGGGGGSVFSASTFSELSNSIKDALGYSDHNTISDPYGDDSYLQQESSTIEGAQDSSIVESQQESSIEARFERMERKQQEIQHKQLKNQRLSHLKQQQQRNSNPHTYQKQYGKDPPRTPQRTKQEEEQYLKQKEAFHTMTPKTETSNSDDSLGSAPVDERCCGIFRRAFEDEKVFRRLVHSAVFMLIIFSMMSIYVIIKSAENKQVAPTPSPLEFQNPTMIRPPSSSGNMQGEPSPVPTKWVPTMAPTRLTPEALREIILQAFPGAITAVDDPSSAQARALAWLSSDDSMDAFFVSQKLIQRWALAVLYYSTNGEEWKTQDKWLTNHDECEWYTADPYTPVCNENGLLYSLHLRNNGLMGTLPDELVLLSNSLERFYLQVNRLTGSIPGELGGMEILENLAIGRNQLSGTIPAQMQSMEELRLIDMSSNRIGGSLPTVLGQMPNLASFLVNENRLTGTIPSEFGELTALTTLLVQDNRLEGDMPLQVCEMRNTKTFFWVIVDCEAVNCIEECRCQCS